MKNAVVLLKRLEAAGYEAYLVGGCVRDIMMNITPHDYDITTSALPDDTIGLFSDLTVIPTGLKHGTVTVVLGGRQYEITTFRQDGKYSDGRRPDAVRFARTLREDVSRRDFTVNSMAMDVRGKLYDFFGGAEDIRNRIIRCVGNPEERFSEDALRLLRAVRFSSKTGFSLEKETAEAILSCRRLIKNVSAERICSEIFGFLRGDFSVLLLSCTPLFCEIFPEIEAMAGCPQNNIHHVYNVWKHSVKAAQSAPCDEVMRFALLFHDCAKPDVRTTSDGQDHFYGHAELSAQKAGKICSRLKMSSSDRARIVSLIKYHDCPLDSDKKLLRRRLVKFGEDFLRQLIVFKRADNAAQSPDFDRSALYDDVSAALDEILREDNCFSLDRLEVKGNDLYDLGLRGREIGDALQKLLGLVVDKKCENDREKLIKALKDGK